MTKLGKVIGERIRNYRKKQGLSQEELAHLASMHTSYVGEIERSEKSPTLESLEKITSALGITLEELFSHSQVRSKSQHSLMISEIVNQVQSLPMNDLKRITQVIELMKEMNKK
ncbi:MAG: helix-turn-helix domain-containing protein [Candidatus Pristimantibacillus sp.]